MNAVRRWWGRLTTAHRTALVAGALFELSYLLLVCTRTGQTEDYRLWGNSLKVPGNIADIWSDFSRRLLAVSASVLLLLEAWARRSLRLLVVGLLSTGITTGVAFTLRNLLPRPDLGNIGIPVNTFPSSHVALAATPLVVLIAWHGRRSVVSAVYVVLIALAMAGNTMKFVHRPSDTLGALLLAVTVTATVMVLVRWTGRDTHPAPGGGTGPAQ